MRLANTPKTIYPCPFSKGYGMPANQAWQLLKVFFIYRLILACSIILIFYFRSELLSDASVDGQPYKYTSVSHLTLTIVLGICIFWRFLGYSLFSAAADFYRHHYADLADVCFWRGSKRHGHTVGSFDSGRWFVDKWALRFGFCRYCELSAINGGAVCQSK